MPQRRRRNNDNKTAVAYIRVSTEEQVSEGVSLEAQEATLRAYCTMRNMELVDLVADPGVSAGKPLADREGGRRVLELVRSGQVGSVVGYKLDRLFRDAADCLNVTSDWDRSGVTLHLVDLGGQAVDTSSAMGRFFLTVMAGAAEMERNLVRERTKAAMAHKKAQGKRVGQIPFGSRIAEDGEHLEPESDEQQVIEYIRELRDRGMTLRGITARLNEEEVRARGERWHLTSVARVLRREAA
jgi:DNA invertase Pin-like site-specific DNA recombinase